MFYTILKFLYKFHYLCVEYRVMDSRRQSKIAHLIQEVFSNLLQRKGKDLVGDSFLTVTQVKVTPDLGVARIYISILADPNAKDIIKSMNKNKFEFRRLMGNEMHNDLRKIPELEFYLDDVLDYVDKMDKLFKKIHDEENLNKEEDS